jgi:phage terminase large subunit-like protein
MSKHPAEQYAADVVSGKIPAARWVKLACQRHVDDLRDGHKRGLWFDERAAKAAIAFYSVLRHWKGEWAGEVIRLEPAQQFWLWSLFGWKRDDGTRRFRTAYLEVGRKNAKTTTAAGIGLFLAFAEGEGGAEVYSAATKQDQAKIVHRDATEMVKRSPQLKKIITVFRNNLHSVESGSKFEPLSADYNSLDGLNIQGVIADELHAWPSPELWGVLKTGTGSRRQPLMLAITTAGVDQQGICYAQREYLTRILKGIIEDDSYWGMIYTLDTRQDWPDLEQDDNWQNEANWIKANPLLGVSKKWDTMRQDAREATNRPAELNHFLRWHLNIWTTAVTRWINPFQWDECGSVVVNEQALYGRLCYGGLDLSSTGDLTAFVLVFPPSTPGGLWEVLCRFWIPADNIIDRVRRDQVPYDQWVREGYIETTPGNSVDYDFILAQIESDMSNYNIAEVAFDPWNATHVSNRLIENNITMVDFRQGFVSMNPAMKALEVAIAQGELAHGDSPVLNWMADNLVVRTDPAGNIKPDKERSREKIDGMVALAMAHHRARLTNNAPRQSVYETRGMMVV